MYVAGIMSAAHRATSRGFDDSSISMSVDLSSSVMLYSRQLLEAADMDNYRTGGENGGPAQGRCRAAGRFTSPLEDRIRRKLKFFFMNPWQKWKAKKKFPFKMILQIIKVVFVTIQLSMFGNWRSSHVNFVEKSEVAFKHLYLMNWAPAFETLPYPPASGPYAVYTIPEFYKMVNYIQTKYNDTEKLAIGTYHFNTTNDKKWNITLCNTHYSLGKIFAFNSTYYYDKNVERTCTRLGTVKKFDNKTRQYNEVFDIEEYMKQHNQSINFDSVIRIEVLLALKTVHLKGLSKANLPDCFQFDITVTYENKEHNGQMLITLDAQETSIPCHGHINFDSDNSLVTVLTSIFDFLVIFISVVSLILTSRSLIRGQMLRKEACVFFDKKLGKKLDWSDRIEFVDLWYVVIWINDLLTIVGSILKILIENKLEHRYDTCAVTLGTGALLVWFGVVRYLSFFEKYNILVITLKRALPNVCRFLACAGIIYLGFLFCGWLVLGPYHIKFRELSTASEAMFSLVNGDDMFVTFSIISDRNTYVWWYSRIYLYLFISLFIYVVLSVFISVIMDAYETIKYYYEHGFPKSDLFEFIEQCLDGPNSPLYMSDDQEEESTSILENLNCFQRCFQRPQSVPIIVEDSVSTPPTPDESTHLLSNRNPLISS